MGKRGLLSQNPPDFFEEREKKSLRSFYKKKIIELSPSAKRKKQEQITGLLAKLPFWKKARFIAGYQALRDEPCLSSFYKLWEDKLCFPAVRGPILKFYKASGKWRKNSLSVLEPLSAAKNQVPLDQISVFLIPGRAFDRAGGRLGRGKGYYDRTLAPLAQKRGFRGPAPFGFEKGRLKQALFAGVAFAEQIHSDRLSLLPHDVLMNFLATDRFVFIPLCGGGSLSGRRGGKAKSRGLARQKARGGKSP